MVSIGTLVAFIVVSVGVIILRVREPDLPRAFKVPGYPVTPVLSVLGCLYILYSLHWYTWVAFGRWVAVVLAFYFAWGRHHSALNTGDEVAPTTAEGTHRDDRRRLSGGQEGQRRCTSRSWRRGRCGPR